MRAPAETADFAAATSPRSAAARRSRVALSLARALTARRGRRSERKIQAAMNFGKKLPALNIARHTPIAPGRDRLAPTSSLLRLEALVPTEYFHPFHDCNTEPIKARANPRRDARGIDPPSKDRLGKFFRYQIFGFSD